MRKRSILSLQWNELLLLVYADAVYTKLDQWLESHCLPGEGLHRHVDRDPCLYHPCGFSLLTPDGIIRLPLGWIQSSRGTERGGMSDR